MTDPKHGIFTTRLCATIAAIMVAQLPAVAGATDPYGIEAENGTSSEYTAAFDRATDGLFSQLVSKGDADFTITRYPTLISAYAEIEDSLFDAYSPHANQLPRWYAERLRAMGLDGLAAPESKAFLEQELASGDFDRVVHAYYILSRSRLPLLVAGAPTSLWAKMLAVAKADGENRYWISLALAEAKMLPAHAYDRRRTKMATRIESVRERIGKNADALGPRIPRVLGLSKMSVQVSHPRIGDAEKAAVRRVREHQMAALGADTAYQSLREELERMEKGEFESKRFLTLMQDDLPFLFTRFGPPPDPERVLETLRVLCRGLGQNRNVLWAAADAVAKRYESAIAAASVVPEPEPRSDAADVLAMGSGAIGHVMTTLANAEDPEGVFHLFSAEIIPAAVAEHPPEDPAALRAAIRDAYYTVGYPPSLRPAYLRALESLGPEESAQAAVSKETVSGLRDGFSKSRDAEGFARVFDDFRRASGDGRIPSRDADPDFVTEFASAAIRVLETEQLATVSALRRASEARAARSDASANIEDAEAAIVDANRKIREANARLSGLEEVQQAAMAARNDAALRRNQAVERANAAGRGPDAETARAEARRVEAELGAVIESQEKAFHDAARALEEAERRASSELQRAQREEARARSEATRENDFHEADRRAESDAQKSRAHFDEVRRQLVAGLGFVGIEGDPGAVGNPDGDPDARLAGLASLLDEASQDGASQAALQREEQGDDAALRRLATLVLTQRAQSQ